MLAFIQTLTQDELFLMNRINVSALKRAVARVEDGQTFTNFKLFEYTSGSTHGILHEEVLPSGRILKDYIVSSEFLQFLVGASYLDLYFKLWSREINTGRRELFLCIKQVPENTD